jgi:alkylation response protein AidB-like acyl-CoA dehydrogenase
VSVAEVETEQSFLADNHPGRPPKGKAERLAWQKGWFATLADHGLVGPSWPVEAGGMGLSFADQVVYAEEMGRARLPGYPGTGVAIAGPTIVKYGTPDQRRRWLPGMLRADQVWSQGYSEPDAGSDLPSLRTKAVRDGDRYVVSGAKVWSSSADIADRIYTLVRTGTPESRQYGITYLVIDAHAAGVTVSPIRDLTGGSSFCEIVFDDVQVPVEDRIGDEDGGWPIARTSLGHERAASALIQATFYRRVFDELIELARERGMARDPVMRQRLARAETAVRIMYVSGARTIAQIGATGEPGPGSSVSRLFISTTEQWLHELAVDITGAYGMLGGGDPYAVQRGRWMWGLLRTRASTIGAGTAEIQRNTIAERVLGLPYEPSATR